MSRNSTVERLGHAVELGVRLTLWMQQRRTPASARDISLHFGVSRATGYRWLQFYLAATAQLPTTTRSVHTLRPVIAAPGRQLQAAA